MNIAKPLTTTHCIWATLLSPSGTTNSTPSPHPSQTCTVPPTPPSPSPTKRIANGAKSLATHAVATPPHAPFMPSPNGASPSVVPVARPPHHCVPITAAPDVRLSHLTISPLFSVPQHKPSPASASWLPTSTPAAYMREGTWCSSAVRSTPTPSASSATGNWTRCSNIYMPRLSPLFKTWPPPC